MFVASCSKEVHGSNRLAQSTNGDVILQLNHNFVKESEGGILVLYDVISKCGFVLDSP